MNQTEIINDISNDTNTVSFINDNTNSNDINNNIINDTINNNANDIDVSNVFPSEKSMNPKKMAKRMRNDPKMINFLKDYQKNNSMENLNKNLTPAERLLKLDKVKLVKLI
jgi:hypothetical protein